MSGLGFKVGSLLLRTVAKPIANAIKRQAKEHEGVKKVCMSIAQTVHETDIKLRMRLLGETKIKVRPLNEKAALDLMGNIISEGFLFLVAGSLIIYEVKSRKLASDQRSSFAEDIDALRVELTRVASKMDAIDSKLDHVVYDDQLSPKLLKPHKILPPPPVVEETPASA